MNLFCNASDHAGGLFGKSISTFFEPAIGSAVSDVIIDLDVSGLAIRLSGLCDDTSERLAGVGQAAGVVTAQRAQTGTFAALGSHRRLHDAIIPAEWQNFQCKFENGIVDHIAIKAQPVPSGFDNFLIAAWPGLRRYLIQQAEIRPVSPPDSALLWMVTQKVNAAIVVMDSDLNVLRTNDAGADMLRDGRLLTARNGGLECVGKREMKTLRQAVKESLQNKAQAEFVVILRGANRRHHVPMSMSVYNDPGSKQKLFLLMLPLPPEQKQIERIAREMGLTPVEARVAALIRSGHSNRKAAELSGLKIETFNTYAKRVMSKMNVTCRSEMAQMLTWQATMERSS